MVVWLSSNVYGLHKIIKLKIYMEAQFFEKYLRSFCTISLRFVSKMIVNIFHRLKIQIDSSTDKLYYLIILASISPSNIKFLFGRSSLSYLFYFRLSDYWYLSFLHHSYFFPVIQLILIIS